MEISFESYKYDEKKIIKKDKFYKINGNYMYIKQEPNTIENYREETLED